MKNEPNKDTPPLETLVKNGTDALGAWISKEIAETASHAIEAAEGAFGVTKPSESAPVCAPTPKTPAAGQRRAGFAKRWASGFLVFALVAIPAISAWQTEKSLPKAPPQGHRPIYLLGQTEADAVRWDTDAGAALEKREAIEAQLSQCVASGDCVRTTGVGSDATANIDLSLLGKAVDCESVCAVDGVHRDPQDMGKTLPVYVETKTNGEVVAWSEFEGRKVGRSYKPAISGQKIFWSGEEFNR